MLRYLVIHTVIGLLAVSAPGGQKEYFVATDGRDANPGTKEQPFATIEAARAALRLLKGSHGLPTGGVTVWIRGGDYRLERPIVFQPEDSGTADRPITYAAYQDETPFFHGSRSIQNWTKDEHGLWSACLPETAPDDWYFHQLFVNGQRRTRARTPNEGYLHTDGPLPEIVNPQKQRDNPQAKLGFRYREGDLQQWNDLGNVNIFLYHSWTASLHWIAELDEERQIVRFTAPSNWPIGYWERTQRYYVENYREALDAPGEWYLDSNTRTLYYQPMDNEDLPQTRVEAPVLRKLVQFNGDPETGRFVEHIRLHGLSFGYADWARPKTKVRPTGRRRPGSKPRSSRAERAIASWTGVKSPMSANTASISNAAAHIIKLARCHVHDLGAGGVRIGHMSSPASANQATEHNTVENCWIHDGGNVFRAGVGVWIGRSSHNHIAHNEISNFDYTGISVGWSWGYAESSAHHNVIEYNHVHHIGRGVLSDMGGIYTLGVSPGTVVNNNCFHDIQSYAYGGWGLYTDEGSSGIVLENNIVYNTKTGGFHQHYGKDNVVRNNILAFSLQGQIQRSRQEKHNSFTFERNIVIFDNGQLLAGNWGDDNFEMDYNVYWHTGGEVVRFLNLDFKAWQAKGKDTNSIIADPHFADATGRNFQLNPESPAIKLGFKPIDRQRIGLIGDPDWIQLPRRIDAVHSADTAESGDGGTCGSRIGLTSSNAQRKPTLAAPSPSFLESNPSVLLLL